MSLPLDPAWNIVRLGLSLMIGSGWVVFSAALIAAGLGGSHTYLASNAKMPSALPLINFAALAFAGIALAAVVVSIIGQLLCCLAPRQEKVRALAVAANLCQAGGALVLAALVLLPWHDMWLRGLQYQYRDLAGCTGFLAAACIVIGHGLFVFFLGRVAKCFNNSTIAGDGAAYIALGFMTLVLVPILLGVGAIARSLVLVVMALVLAFALLAGYLGLLKKTRDVICKGQGSSDWEDEAFGPGS